jgi:carboxyl-terminal processing protease
MIRHPAQKKMKSNISRLTRILFLLTGVIIGVVIVGFTGTDSDYFFKINKSIDIFGTIYREVAANYVEEIDPEKFMEAGVDGMLGTLDPYTNFIAEREADEVQLITSGTYGGIGVTIGLRDGYITILSLMDGYSAQRQGVRPGDRIVEVDGKPVKGMNPQDIRSLTRGEPGTEVRIRVERVDESQSLEFILVREKIQLKNITYADYVSDGIAYIRLERFTMSAGDELRLALKELKLKGTLNGIILDLRGNPGGLLEAAVNIVEKFVTKGNLVVSTKGRSVDSEKKYIVSEDPLIPDLPMIILVNGQSASASEVVAGAIQDLDRGLIVGTRSFGKGLVQTVMPLVYNTQLKITTAKYYTPSGRCIQEINYGDRNAKGVFTTIPDSLKRKFKTMKGRLELEAGGIEPDSIVREPEPSALYQELMRRSMFFRFASWYTSVHPDTPKVFNDEILLRDFKKFLDSLKFAYTDEVEVKLNELCDLAEKCKYSAEIKSYVAELKSKLTAEKNIALDRHSKELLSSLKTEIMSRYKGEKGRIEEGLRDDIQVKTAIDLLSDRKAYDKRLSPN